MKKQLLLLLAILMTVGITATFAGNLDTPTQHPIIDPNAIYLPAGHPTDLLPAGHPAVTIINLPEGHPAVTVELPAGHPAVTVPCGHPEISIANTPTEPTCEPAPTEICCEEPAATSTAV
ncbi:MAG: hypothetical protein LUQ70_06320 [Methanobacteriaceae archaeon]|nr:hypothetical protein [Methanobacteriaceae archaeon]